MPGVAIIADDLTGAADSGVQLVRAGYRTAVVFQGSSVPRDEDLDAVALDTDSRAMPAGFAAKRVVEAAHAVRDARIVYKKMDSTLRGNVAAELAAALEATGRRCAIVAPAFPAAGRTTLEGVQLVDGTPVHETGFAEDPRNPVRDSHVPTLLAQAIPDVETLSAADLADAAKVHHAAGEFRCLVVDAVRDEDLAALVKAVPDPAAVLWAGSAGLASAVGKIHPGPGAVEEPSYPRASGVLVVVGSLNAVARDQLERLAEERDCPVFPAAAGIPDALEGVREALSGSGCAALCSDEERGSSEEVVGALSEDVARLSDEELFEALVLTGGETAVAVARRLGAAGIRLEGEIEAGVVVGTLVGPRPYRAVTKAGGFGDGGTLSRVVRSLSDGREG